MGHQYLIATCVERVAGGSADEPAAFRPGEVSVHADRHRLRQLLLVLFDNAVKYNRPLGSVAITLSVNCGLAKLQVNNTGSVPGNPERMLSRFVREDNADPADRELGLGLSIARSIATSHGGSIRLVRLSEREMSAQVSLPLFDSELEGAGGV